MRTVLKMAVGVLVLTAATIVVFAGPCEDSCVYSRDQCYNQANANRAACIAPFDEALSNCQIAAEEALQFCIHYTPLDTCNANYEYDLYQCTQQYWWGQEYCDMQAGMEYSDCNNNYENCLFACEHQ